MNMKYLLALLTLIIVSYRVSGQSAYYPLKEGSSHTYAYGSQLYDGAYDDKRVKVKILNDSKTLDGNVYFVSETSMGSNGNYRIYATSYLRIDGKGSIMMKQNLNHKEVMMIPSAPKVGTSWSAEINNVAHTNTVVDLNGSIKTKQTTYNNCLVLEQKANEGIVTRSYYKKGVGMVATTMLADYSEKIFIYLINN